ncbi:hypothetical protein [Hallella colorans]|uniref:Uncharacterized protein n=1 Tax=Hallella colorans TaxID=1703337 RepID=A0A2U0UP29_9BACT|nr:hypothetical protein [Hallella colorans]PVX59409.1 hypothetical protein C7379_101181 [Hallella colorans]
MEELRRGHILYGERQLINSNFAIRYFQQIDIFQVISDNNFNIVPYEKKRNQPILTNLSHLEGGYRHLLLNNSAFIFTVELDFKINKIISFGFTGAYSSRMKSSNYIINEYDKTKLRGTHFYHVISSYSAEPYSEEHFDENAFFALPKPFAMKIIMSKKETKMEKLLQSVNKNYIIYPIYIL